MVIDNARQQGRMALAMLRRRLVEQAADLLKEHPDFAAGVAEIGLVDKDWIDDPSGLPVRSATTVEMVQRFLERSVEQEPSLIAKLGLNAIELLSMSDAEAATPGSALPASIVFTDLEDFTRFTAEVGDEAARDYLARHHKAVGPVIRSRGGRIVKRIGDGLLITFVAPEAAVLAALEVEALDHGVLRLRAGAHHGEVVSLGGDVVGNDVNLAARVADAATGGQVLVTAALRGAVVELGGVEFGSLEPRSFKGIAGTVEVCTARLSK
jgi:class 3 adenylate cyclase